MNRSVTFIATAALALAGASAVAGASGTTATKPASTAASGAAVFERWCTPCHGRGPRYPGTASLAAKYGKDLPAALEDRTDLTPESVSYFVRHGISVMPQFRKTEITDTELAALGSYLARKRGSGK